MSCKCSAIFATVKNVSPDFAYFYLKTVIFFTNRQNNLVEEKVDLKNSRNVFVAALILVLAIGVKYGANDDIAIGPIHLSGLAIAAIVGIFINAIMPSKKILDKK